MKSEINELYGDMPIIKTLIVCGEYYFYDSFTNQILQISKEQFIEICQLKEVGLAEYEKLKKQSQAYKDIIMLIKQGFLKEKFINSIEHNDTNFITCLTDRCINQLVLEVTTGCNFMCRYCHQASYGIHHMTHMSRDIALRSVDFLFEHSKDAREVLITFYGGEPLINFELIKTVVFYADEKFKTKPVRFNITTNASLFTDEIINFFIKYHISVLISIDGDEEFQNNHRKFAIDGTDTYKTVWANIMHIKEQFPIYFETYIRFNSVIFEDQDIKRIKEFYENNNIPKSAYDLRKAELSGIDYLYSIYELNKHNDSECFEERYQVPLNKLINKKEIFQTWHHDGPCVPAVRRLFISTVGNFFPCEKIDCDTACLIGDLNTGIDIKKVDQLLNIGRLTQEECKTCWSLRFCSMCASHCRDNGALSRNKKLSYCTRQREDVAKFLVDYIKHHKGYMN